MTLPLGPILLAALLANACAFAAQGIDKRSAMRAARRIPERTLLLLGLPLAAPGMLLGMKFFRHKTRKSGFLAGAALVVFANLLTAASLGWLAMTRTLILELRLY